eukprot:4853131-Prymnesium_polylepis.1
MISHIASFLVTPQLSPAGFELGGSNYSAPQAEGLAADAGAVGQLGAWFAATGLDVNAGADDETAALGPDNAWRRRAQSCVDADGDACAPMRQTEFRSRIENGYAAARVDSAAVVSAPVVMVLDAKMASRWASHDFEC